MENPCNVKTKILQTYVIKVSIDSFTWTVERRYREFESFDLKRFEDRKKSFLPPKKLVGNMDFHLHSSHFVNHFDLRSKAYFDELNAHVHKIHSEIVS
uniref:PX domain-containing protein n=1 Tax=Ascaris lumbricoides TaxID=6252 RepID=A0A0M3HHB7_ASCLU